MPTNAFIGATRPPSDEELSAALGPARPLWDKLLLCDLTPEWNSYSPKAGWALRLKRDKRNIVYLSPCGGTILASFALGDRAVAAARAAKLPIEFGRKYAEGTAVRFEVKSARDVATVGKLVAIKLAN